MACKHQNGEQKAIVPRATLQYKLKELMFDLVDPIEPLEKFLELFLFAKLLHVIRQRLARNISQVRD
jgi:hypothetical protein